SESSSERTHNARRYATLPGGGAVPPCGIDPSFRRGPARLGAASVAPPMTLDAPTSHKARSGTPSSGSSERPRLRGRSLLERVHHRSAPARRCPGGAIAPERPKHLARRVAFLSTRGVSGA
ncbi:MAG: hypothetical protein KJ626_07380, partial [Verrucomicrobia bacterium]|nr:hypothetical protein [Verrucomicrobiota bacterium]